MPAFASPHQPADREGLIGYLAHQQDAFRIAAWDLSEAEARMRPAAVDWTIGGLVKRATVLQKAWTERILAAPELLSEVPYSGIELECEHPLLPGETLASVLVELAAQNTVTLAAVEEADLDAPVPVPRGTRLFPDDVEAWNVRWVVLHLIEELSRHAGYADIVRESNLGWNRYDVVDGSEGWAPYQTYPPFKPRSATGDLTLEIHEGVFYAQNDEAAFFEWLDKIPCVKSYVGNGLTLYVIIESGAIDRDALHEFVGLCRRYKIDSTKLRILAVGQHADWFRDPERYWHEEVFGQGTL